MAMSAAFFHRLDGKVPRRLDHDPSLAADPRDDGGPIFVVVAAAGLALLPPATGSAAQRLLAASCGLALVAGGVLEVIGFHRPCQLALHLIGQGGIAQPPTPAIKEVVPFFRSGRQRAVVGVWSGSSWSPSTKKVVRHYRSNTLIG